MNIISYSFLAWRCTKFSVRIRVRFLKSLCSSSSPCMCSLDWWETIWLWIILICDIKHHLCGWTIECRPLFPTIWSFLTRTCLKWKLWFHSIIEYLSIWWVIIWFKISSIKVWLLLLLLVWWCASLVYILSSVLLNFCWYNDGFDWWFIVLLMLLMMMMLSFIIKDIRFMN